MILWIENYKDKNDNIGLPLTGNTDEIVELCQKEYHYGLKYSSNIMDKDAIKRYKYSVKYVSGQTAINKIQLIKLATEKMNRTKK